MTYEQVDAKERMLNYYPDVIKAILEFQAIADSDGIELNTLREKYNDVLNDAYLTTMGEARIIEWEHILKITPLADSSFDDRRDTVVARIRGQGKLNTALISDIVNAFTGGVANSWIEDSVLYVEITPPPTNKQYRFENVEQEIKHKVPAHLDFKVSRNYFEWGEIKQSYNTWQDVCDYFNDWNDVLIYSPFNG